MNASADHYFRNYILPVCESEHTEADKALIFNGQHEEWAARVGDPQWPEAGDCAALCRTAADVIELRATARRERSEGLAAVRPMARRRLGRQR